jgi:hypothetical protein
MERKMAHKQDLVLKVKWMIYLSQGLFYQKIIKIRKKILVLQLSYMSLDQDCNLNWLKLKKVSAEVM